MPMIRPHLSPTFPGADLLLAALLVISAVFLAVPRECWGQNPQPPPSRPVPAVPAPESSASPSPAVDSLANLLMRQPSVNLKAPVTVLAEFNPPVVALGQSATYRLTVTAMNETVKLPDKMPFPDGLELGATARGQNLDFIGTNYVPRTMLNFSVRPKAIGVYTMPAFELAAYGKPVAVLPARLECVAPGPTPGREPTRLVVELPPGDVYVGQTIPVRIVIYDPVNGLVNSMQLPQIIGDAFVVDAGLIRVRRDVIARAGQIVTAYQADALITPIHEGKFPLMAQAVVVLTEEVPGQPGRIQTSTPLINSEPVMVQVKPLPRTGLLPGFTGGVGSYQLEAPRLSATTVRAGDPVTLTVSIKGEGNIAHLVPPRMENLRRWQIFPPTAGTELNNQFPPYSARTFTYTLIPLSDRLRATPPIPFSYFDLRKQSYLDLTIPPVPIQVMPAPGAALPGAKVRESASGPDDEEPDSEAKEPAMTGLAEAAGRAVGTLTPLQQRPWFLALQLAPVLVLGGLWAREQRRRFRQLHPEMAVKQRARRRLRRQWRVLRQAADTRDAGRYLEAAISALREACAPHTGANAEALVCGDILNELPPAARAGKEGEAVRALFAAVDATRFAGRPAGDAVLFALRPELERLLAALIKRL
jgi:hypothetical protein